MCVQLLYIYSFFATRNMNGGGEVVKLRGGGHFFAATFTFALSSNTDIRRQDGQ